MERGWEKVKLLRNHLIKGPLAKPLAMAETAHKIKAPCKVFARGFFLARTPPLKRRRSGLTTTLPAVTSTESHLKTTRSTRAALIDRLSWRNMKASPFAVEPTRGVPAIRIEPLALRIKDLTMDHFSPPFVFQSMYPSKAIMQIHSPIVPAQLALNIIARWSPTTLEK